MSEQPGLKSVPVGMSPLAQYFVGHQLMLRERLTYEQWSILERMPLDHPESAVWDNRRKGD